MVDKDIKKHTKELIEDALRKISIEKGDTVLVHANASPVMNLSECDWWDDALELMKEAFLNVLGEEGTLIVPTFNYEFCKGKSYDHKKTPSQLGLFSNSVLFDKRSIRSLHPVFSFSAIGKNSEELCKDLPATSFGKGSFFDRIYNKNVKLIFFNVGLEACSFIHYIEQAFGVDYRFLKYFRGIVINGESEFDYVIDYNVRCREKEVEEENLIPLTNKLLSEKKLKMILLEDKYPIYQVGCQDVYAAAIEELAKNPYFFLKTPPKQVCKINEVMNLEYDKQNNEHFGIEMYEFIKKLYPICRSITGNGLRETLKIISEQVPLKIREISSGTKVFDWTVPKEWNIKDAYVKNSKGEKIIDFKKSNLHVLNYSIPINKKVSLKELKEHLFTLPEYPDWIPYLTSYYKENWGFCITHKQYEKLEEDTYEVVIDSTLENGSLTYGELCLKGESAEEVLLTCYVCHPSLCNDNLTGVAIITFLAKYLKNIHLKYSYRFLFIPETIGSITWLSLNEDKISNIKHGLIATCLGDSGNFTYKKSRNETEVINKVVQKVLEDSGMPYKTIDFDPFNGSDERQFCSPGFNMPIGSLMRTKYSLFPEYHTSSDNLDFIKPENLADSLKNYIKVIFVLENDGTYLSLNPKCEPQLGKRGLYTLIGGNKNFENSWIATFWILNLSDGKNSLLDISMKSGVNFKTVKECVNMLISTNLIKKIA